MGGAAGGGFIFVFIILLGIAALIYAFTGWRLGRRIAMRDMSERSALTFAIMLIILPLAFVIYLASPDANSEEVFAIRLFGYASGILWVWAFVAVFALVSWAFNLDDYFASRRMMRKSEEGPSNG